MHLRFCDFKLLCHRAFILLSCFFLLYSLLFFIYIQRHFHFSAVVSARSVLYRTVHVCYCFVSFKYMLV